MKICHICSNYDAFFTDFMDFQARNGVNLRVFYFRVIERGFPKVSAPYLDIRLNYRNWHRFFFRLKEKLVLRDFMELYNNKKFDLIHAHTLFSNGYIALQAKKHWGIPFVVAVRNTDINIFFKYRLTLRGLGIKVLKEAEKVVFLSSEYRDQLFEKYVPYKYREKFLEKSVIIPNGINEIFHNNKYERGRKIDKLEPIRILTVGYISKRKNQLTVCKAIEELHKRGLKATYTVIGKPLDDRLLKKILSYPFVRYVPFIPKEKLIKEYRKAHILVLPSTTETFGLVYAEAMSQGLPIIYTRGQGFDGQFDEGVVGYSVDCHDDQEIASKIELIIGNYSRISANCTSLVQKFNWEKIGKQYIDIYKGILKG